MSDGRATPYRAAKCGARSLTGLKCQLPKGHEGHHRRGSKRWAQLRQW